MKSSQKGFAPIVIVLAVIAFLAVVGGGVWYYAKTAEPGPAVQKPTEQKPSQPSVDETADWSADTDYEHGFEIKYPSSWNIQGAEIHDPSSNAYLAISKLENPKNLSFDDWWEENMVVGGRPTALYSSENTTVNGVKAKIAYMPPDKSGWHIHIADSQNNIYSLVAEGPIADKTIFDEILSTFKFIESNDSVPAVQSDSDQESGLQDDICTVLANEPDSQLSAIKLPGNCGQNLDIGKDIKNWKYIPVFHEWDTEDTYTGPALALWDENGKFVQKITETFKQGSGSQAGGGSFDNDINFDGYKDLQVEICPGPVDIELATFDYWIFDPISKKFKKDPVLNNITNAEFDKDKKMITSGAGVLNACFGDPKCGPGWETTYKFNSSSGVYQELYRPDNLPKFEDFPAKEIYTGKPAEVNFQDHPLAKKFDETGGPGGAYQGLLTREAAKGPNFDGDYRLIKWSCGSSCVAVAIIDIPVGDIVYSSFTDENNWPDFSPWEGLGYRVDSSLLVVSGRYYDWSPFPSSILSIGFKL